jgi:hypothetical protein
MLATSFLFDHENRSIINGVVMIILGLYLAFNTHDKFDIFSPAFFFGISFVIFYGFGAIFPFIFTTDSFFYNSISRVLDYYADAGLLTISCIYFFIVGYNHSWKFIYSYKSNLLQWNINIFQSKVIFILSFILGALAFIIMLVNGTLFQSSTPIQSSLFYSAIGFIQSFSIVSLVISYYLYRVTSFSFYWMIASLVSFSTVLMFGLVSGSKTRLLIPLILVVFVLNYVKGLITKKQSIAGILILIAFLSVLMPFNSFYRDIQINEGDSTSFTNSLTMVANTFDRMVEGDKTETIDLAVSYLTSRLSNISVVATIFKYQDDDSNHIHYGSSYARVLYGLIPRFIYLEKPALTIGRIIAVEFDYGPAEQVVLGEEMSNTSIGVTFIGEMLYNFSYLAFVVAFLFGIMYRLIYLNFIRSLNISPIASVVLYSLIWYTMIFTVGESNFASSLAGIVKILLLIFMVFIMLRVKKVKA